MAVKISKTAPGVEEPTTTDEVPGPDIKAKPIVGKVSKQKKTGGAVETEIPVGEVVSNEPLANVGFSVAYTKNLGNYESMKVSVSLNVPCKNKVDEINEAFMFAKLWCDEKMTETLKEDE